MPQIFCRPSPIADARRLYEKIVCPGVVILLSTLLFANPVMATAISFAVDASLSEEELGNTSRVIRAIAKNLAPGTPVSLTVFDRAYQNGVPMAVVDEQQLSKIDSVLNNVDYSATSNIATGIEKAFSDVAEQEQAQIILIGNAAIELEEPEKVKKFTQWLDLVLMPKMQASGVTLTTVDIDRPNDSTVENILNRGDFTQLFEPAEALQTAKKIAMILPSGTVSEELVQRDLNNSLEDTLDTDAGADTDAGTQPKAENRELVGDTATGSPSQTSNGDTDNTDDSGQTAADTSDLTSGDTDGSNTNNEAESPTETLTGETGNEASNNTAEQNTGGSAEVLSKNEEPASTNQLYVLAAAIVLSLLAVAAALFTFLKRRNKQEKIKPVPQEKTVKKDHGRYFSADESASAQGLFNKHSIDSEGETQINVKPKATPQNNAETELNTAKRTLQQEVEANLDDTQPRAATSENNTVKKDPVDDSSETAERTTANKALEELRTITRIKQEGNNIE